MKDQSAIEQYEKALHLACLEVSKEYIARRFLFVPSKFKAFFMACDFNWKPKGDGYVARLQHGEDYSNEHIVQSFDTLPVNEQNATLQSLIGQLYFKVHKYQATKDMCL